MASNDLPNNDLLNDARRFQFLVAGIKDYAIYMLDMHGYVSSWNAGAQRFKGYLEPEILGRHFSLFYTPDDIATGLPARALQTALDHGKYESEGWRVRKDGTHFWAQVVIDPVRGANGQLIGFAKITRDITEHKKALDALHQSEQQFRLLVQGVTDYAIYMLDTAGRVSSWNSGAQRIKGYAAEEVVGRLFSMFHTPEDQAAGIPARALETAQREGRFEAEAVRVRKDGSRFWAHVVIDSIRNDMGELIGYAKVTRDVTERRRAAEELARAQAALFQSQKMEALGMLTGGVAHDFNNLLAVVASGIDVLSLQERGRSDARVLDSVRRAVERGATLTQQLLSFARQQPLKSEQCNLNELVDGFESVLRRAANSSIAFDVALAPQLSAVMIDAARFETTLLNLVVNARDAMPQGGKLRIATANVQLKAGQVGGLAAGPYVRVTVADNGSGMPAEVAARAFEPFFTTKEIGKGTGLGLSQAYGFIAQSGGEITITSNPGKGTDIDMYLPAIDAGEVEREPEQDPSETVLIVEDEQDLRDVAAELFRSIGYEVFTAGSGVEALDILDRGERIDILFSDVMMPNGMNGVELARMTREKFPGVRILLASGYPLPALKAEYNGLDDFTFMNKPYRLAELARKLRLTS